MLRTQGSFLQTRERPPTIESLAGGLRGRSAALDLGVVGPLGKGHAATHIAGGAHLDRAAQWRQQLLCVRPQHARNPCHLARHRPGWQSSLLRLQIEQKVHVPHIVGALFATALQVVC